MKHKNLKARLMAGALALVLSVGIGMTPAMASSPWDDLYGYDYGTMGSGSSASPATNTVTVNDAVPGATYNLYKLLQLEHKEVDGTKQIATYRYSYDSAIKDTIKGLVEKEAFAYVAGKPTEENPRLGFGFKVDGDNDLVFITPYTSETDGSVDYDSTENAIVRTMMVEFADELRKSVDAGSLTVSQTKTAGDTVPEGGNLTVSFEKVPNGYWLITSNAGARSIIFTSPEEADISQVVNVNEKNPAPTVEKKVFDADDAAGTVTELGGSWKDANDVQIGDTVKYKITVELYKGAENIIVYDNMTDGLTFKALEGVKFYPRKSATEYGREVYPLGGGAPTTEPLELTGKTDVYTLTENADKHGFTLTFKNAFTNPAAGADNRDEKDPLNNVFLGDLSTLDDDGGRVEIEYTAVLNENAVINGDHELICDKAEGADHTHSDACYTDSNDNDAYVKYGHITGVEPGEDPTDPTDPPRESNHDDTKTYTYRFSIDKFVDGDKNTKLAGAEFELRQNFVAIGTAAVEGKTNAYITDGKLVLPAAEYVISDDPIALVDITPATEGYAGGKVYRVAKTDDEGNVVEAEGVTTTTKIVTDATGQITIQGLDSMLYSITETASPEGYNRLEKPVMMAIGSVFSENSGKVFIEDATATRADENADYSFNPNVDGSNNATTTVGIANSSGIKLPGTGGIGTTIFYVLGGTMMALAAGAGVIVLKKRKDEEAE